MNEPSLQEILDLLSELRDDLIEEDWSYLFITIVCVAFLIVILFSLFAPCLIWEVVGKFFYD